MQGHAVPYGALLAVRRKDGDIAQRFQPSDERGQTGSANAIVICY